MSLSDLGRISLPTIVGIFLGLAVVTWVQPETQEGMALLIAIAILLANAATQVAVAIRRAIRKKRHPTPY